MAAPNVRLHPAPHVALLWKLIDVKGTSTVVSCGPGKRIAIAQMALFAKKNTTWQWKSNETPITPAIPMQGNGGRTAILPWSPCAWGNTKTGEDLNLTTTGGDGVKGFLSYTLTD